MSSEIKFTPADDFCQGYYTSQKDTDKMLATSWKDRSEVKMNFRQYLESEFLKWQQQQGGRRTVEEFADYLGIGRTTLSMWWNKNDRVPQGDNVRKLADKLGLEVYDALGLKRPDAMLHYINKVWDTLPEEIQEALLQKAKGYAVKNEKDVPHGKRKTSKT